MYLFLVGPPGIGKSTLAPALALRLAAGVVEIDRDIERRTRKSNRDTIEQDGMERFRDLETQILGRLRPTPAWCIVDTGGGTPLRAGNRARMRELGLIVGLRGSLSRVTRGIAATMAKRPNQDLSPEDRARHALTDPERRAGYEDADVTFDVDGATPEATADAIFGWLARTRGLRIDVGTERPYPIVVRAGLVDALADHLAPLGWSGRVALVTEPNAAPLADRARRSLERAGASVATAGSSRSAAARSATRRGSPPRRTCGGFRWCRCPRRSSRWSTRASGADRDRHRRREEPRGRLPPAAGRPRGHRGARHAPAAAALLRSRRDREDGVPRRPGIGRARRARDPGAAARGSRRDAHRGDAVGGGEGERRDRRSGGARP